MNFTRKGLERKVIQITRLMKEKESIVRLMRFYLG